MFRFLVLASFVACALGAIRPTELRPRLDGRIVGGEDIDIKDVPWQISLRYFGSHSCGGSVFSEKVIITAAHCVDGRSATFFTIRAGSTRKSSGGVIVQVAKIIHNENYDKRNINYDIAVLILATPLTFGDTIKPVALPEQDEEIATGAKVTLSGWGTLNSGGRSPDILQRTFVHVVSNDDCNAAYGKITPQMMCAGEPEGGHDTCQGDSGGPATVDGKLVGVVSWGRGCATPGYPGVYARVAAMRDWLDEHIH